MKKCCFIALLILSTITCYAQEDKCFKPAKLDHIKLKEEKSEDTEHAFSIKKIKEIHSGNISFYTKLFAFTLKSYSSGLCLQYANNIKLSKSLEVEGSVGIARIAIQDYIGDIYDGYYYDQVFGNQLIGYQATINPRWNFLYYDMIKNGKRVKGKSDKYLGLNLSVNYFPELDKPQYIFTISPIIGIRRIISNRVIVETSLAFNFRNTYKEREQPYLMSSELNFRIGYNLFK